MSEEELPEGVECIGKDCGICGGYIPTPHSSCRKPKCGTMKKTIHYEDGDNYYCPKCGSVSASVNQRRRLHDEEKSE